MQAPSLDNFPLFKRDPKLVARWPELFAEWVRSFPGLDIPAQLYHAHAWQNANPQNRKKDQVRALLNWFLKEDRMRGSGGPRRPQEETNWGMPSRMPQNLQSEKAQLAARIAKYDGTELWGRDGNLYLVTCTGLLANGGMLLYSKMPQDALERVVKRLEGRTR